MAPGVTELQIGDAIKLQDPECISPGDFDLARHDVTVFVQHWADGGEKMDKQMAVLGLLQTE